MTVRVENGRILASFGDDDEELAPVEARALANELIDAASESERQQEKIRAACAGGHLWGAGSNVYRNIALKEKTTFQFCERDGCTAWQELPGWIEYAAQLHLCSVTGRQLPCLGPGCEYCAATRLGEAIQDMLGDAYRRLADELEPVGEVPSAFAKVRIELGRNDNARVRNG